MQSYISRWSDFFMKASNALWPFVFPSQVFIFYYFIWDRGPKQVAGFPAEHKLATCNPGSHSKTGDMRF